MKPNYGPTVPFFTLKGAQITEIALDAESVIFVTNKGNFRIIHYPDCCENFVLDNIVGNLSDLFNGPITLAEEDNKEPSWSKINEYGSHTWSAYYLENAKGCFEFWFLGESNGYYSETAEFIKIDETKT